MVVFPVMTKECDSETWGFLSIVPSEHMVRTGAHAELLNNILVLIEYEKYAYLAFKRVGSFFFFHLLRKVWCYSQSSDQVT